MKQPAFQTVRDSALIKSTDPVGLYVSSTNTEAAKWYFEKQIAVFLFKNKLLLPEQEGGLKTEKNPDWAEALISGVGKITIGTVDAKTITEVKKTGTLIIVPPVQKLTVEWRTDPHSKTIGFIHDEGGTDKWLIDTIIADSQKTYH